MWCSVYDHLQVEVVTCPVSVDYCILWRFIVKQKPFGKNCMYTSMPNTNWYKKIRLGKLPTMGQICLRAINWCIIISRNWIPARFWQITYSHITIYTDCMTKIAWKFKIVKGFQRIQKLTKYLILREEVSVLFFGALVRAIILEGDCMKNHNSRWQNEW